MGEINFQGASGATYYFHLLNQAGQVWNGASFETPTAAKWADYAIAASEQSTTGYFSGDMPAAAAGWYDVVAFQQPGASPATSDPKGPSGKLNWNGATEVQALPNASHTADGGLPTCGSGNRQLTLAGGSVLVGSWAAGVLSSQLAAAVWDWIVEAGITPSASLTNDSGTQLSEINAGQAMALIMSALAALLSGAPNGPIEISAAGKSTPKRITANVSSGNRTSLTLIVPD